MHGAGVKKEAPREPNGGEFTIAPATQLPRLYQCIFIYTTVYQCSCQKLLSYIQPPYTSEMYSCGDPTCALMPVKNSTPTRLQSSWIEWTQTLSIHGYGQLRQAKPLGLRNEKIVRKLSGLDFPTLLVVSPHSSLEKVIKQAVTRWRYLPLDFTTVLNFSTMY